MTNIATLGFDINTAPLAKANTELNKLVQNAGKAEKAVDSFGAKATAAGSAAAAAMTRAANAAQGAAAAFNAASNASATAATRAAAAQTHAANATRAAAAAATAAAAANTRHASSSIAAANSNNVLTGSFLGLNASTLLSVAAMTTAAYAVGKAMDAYTQLNNTLRIAGIVGQEAVVVQERLFQAATRNGVAIDDVTQFYRRAAITQKEVGASNADMVRMVDAVTAALRVQGTSSKAAAGALLQLSQSFGSGKVKAEEFNSIQEGALPLLQAAANGIDKYKGSVAAMRADVIAGNLSSKEFFAGILKGGVDLEKMASNTKLTMSASFTAATNSFINLMGKMDDATGVSNAVSNAFAAVGRAMDGLSRDQGFLDGLNSAFQAFSGIVGMVKQGLDAVLSVLGGIVSKIQEIMQQKAANDTLAGGVTTNGRGEFVYKKGLEDYNKEAVEASNNTTRLAKEIDNLQGQITKREAMGMTVSGAARKNLETAKQQYQEAKQVFDMIMRDRENLTTKAFSQGLGAPSGIPDAVTSGTMQYGPNLPDTSILKGSGVTPAGKHKGLDALAKIKNDAQQFIVQQGELVKAIGQTEEQAARLGHAFSLLSKFQDANIVVTKDHIEWIDKTSAAMARAEADRKKSEWMHETLKTGEEYIRQQQVEFDVIGMSAQAASAYRKEQEMLNQAKRQGKVLTDADTNALKASAAAQAEAEEKVRSYRDALSFAKELSRGFFEDLREGLNNGRTLWESFGSAAINVLNRIASKITDMAIDGIFDLVFSPGKGTSGGNGSSSKSGGSGSMFGNLFNNSSMGGGGFWGSPIFKPSIDQEIAAWSTGGNVPWMNQLSWGQGIGAIGGAAAGIGQMAMGKGSTSSMVGGITSLVGAGVSLIPGIGQIAGPIISMLGPLLGGLFESKPEPPTMQASGAINFRNGDFQYSGGEYGGASSLSGPLGEVGKSVKSLLDTAKVKATNSPWGLMQQSYSKGDFSNATTFITGPDGKQMQWGQSSDPGMQKQAMDSGAAFVAHKIMMEVDSGISALMREGLGNFAPPGRPSPFSMEELGTAVSKLDKLSEAIKSFGTTTTEAASAIKAIDDSFKELEDIGREFNISASEMNKVAMEKDRLKLKATEGFTNSIDDALLEAKNPLQGSLRALERQRTADLLNNDEFLRLVPGYLDQRNKLEELYLMRRNKMIEEYNEQANSALEAIKQAAKNSIDSIESLLQRLTGGDLANVNNVGQLNNLDANYQQLRAQAFSTYNQEDIADFLEGGAAFAEFAKTYGGGGKITNKVRDQLISDLEALRGTVKTIEQTGVIPANSNAPADTVGTERIMALFTKTMQENAELRALMTRLLAKVGG
jgi:tape measure domain-containing protein